MNSDDCRQSEEYFDLIEELIKGELDPRAAGRVTSHVFACSQCRAEYETLRREKEIYGQYLFDAEPPQNSWADFRVRLASEKENAAPRESVPVDSPRRAFGIFGFWRLTPAMAAALLLFGLGIFFARSVFTPREENRSENPAKNVSKNSPPAVTDETDRQPPADLMTNTGNPNDPASNGDAPFDKNQPPGANNKISVNEKSPATSAAKIEKNPVSPRRKQMPVSNDPKTSENLRRALRLKILETEIAEQIEKTEMLLRSFRNAREVESVETFDVEYERRQARRLLEENRRLRRDAESYGIVYAEEIFGQVEPYLLEIANLEAQPAPEKVRDIKQRVSSQNIIASLQVYGGAAQ
jgi:hypothetical protein